MAFFRKKDKKTPVVTIKKVDPSKYGKDQLVEINDHRTLATIHTFLPELVRSAAEGKSLDAYSCVIPQGVPIVESEKEKGLKKLFKLTRPLKGGGELAKFATPGLNVGNVTSAIFGLASLIVGQIHMNQLNKSLVVLNGKVKSIADFQDSEFKGKVAGIIISSHELTKFQYEFLGKPSVKTDSLAKISTLKQTAVELLIQSNEYLNSLSSNVPEDNKAYYEAVDEASKWLQYQSALLASLEGLAQLDYLYHAGEKTYEQCASSLKLSYEEVNRSRVAIGKWNKDACETLKIDLQENKAKRKGMDAFLHWIPSWFNKEKKYTLLPEGKKEQIEAQTGLDYVAPHAIEEDFSKDLTLIAFEGKIYYLKK